MIDRNDKIICDFIFFFLTLRNLLGKNCILIMNVYNK